MARRRTPLLALATALFVVSTGGSEQSAQAQLWAGFYKPSQPEPQPQEIFELGDDAVCLAEILEAQSRYGIPDNLLLSIGIQEAGRVGKRGLTVWPWSVNAEGKGAFFPTREAMLEWVGNQMSQGVRSIDVGCMQINQKWHGKAFASLEEATDPAINVDYAARYLRDLYRSEGDWWKAAGRYHSGTEKYQKIYLDKLSRNQGVANANLDGFLDMIVDETIANTVLVAEVAPVTPPAVFWGNHQSAETAATFTIYSNSPMRPIIPDYKEMF